MPSRWRLPPGTQGHTLIDVHRMTAADLASSLAAALARRKGDLGDSDDEESDGEWD